jgi:3-oxoacyl-[acyl-carrier protein] reductase
MNLGLEKSRALVTGASRGLGRAIAVALAAEGAEVTAVARSFERSYQLQEPDKLGQRKITEHVCNLADASAIGNLAAILGQVDILVLNTGGPPAGPAADTPDAVWSEQFQSMFLSAIRLTRLALPGMRQRGFGRILVVVSSGVIQPIPNLGVSNALRSALIGWAKTLASEVARDGVTINCLAPGRIATDRVAELDQGRAKREGIDIEQVAKESRASIPAGRYGDTAEFASVAAFLASSRASYMTGSIIRVDGGMIRSV